MPSAGFAKRKCNRRQSPVVASTRWMVCGPSPSHSCSDFTFARCRVGRPSSGSMRLHCGQFGVEVFFVLSGFLITMLLLKEERSTGRIDLRMFYIRRGFRILPPAMVYLLFVACLVVAGISSATSDLFTSAVFVQNFFQNGSSDTGHFWTLAIEEQFYLFWPLALVALPQRLRLGAVAAMAIGLAVFRHEYYRFFPHATVTAFQFHYDGLLIGSLLALARETSWLKTTLDRRLLTNDATIVAAVAGIALLVSPWGEGLGSHGQMIVPTTLSLLMAVIVNAVIHRESSFIAKALTFTPLVWVGLLSYSLYLWQQPFCLAKSSLHMRLPWCLLLAVALAMVSFFFVERPALKLRQRWFSTSRSAKPI